MPNVCGNCGTPVEADTAYCGNCGQNVTEVAAPLPPPVYAPPVYQPPQQPGYAPQPQPQIQPQANGVIYGKVEDNSVLSVGGFIVTMLVMCIPIVNIVMLFVWGFGSNVNLNRRNLVRANLIMGLIGIALWLVLVLVLGVSLASLSEW